jgi:pimeloyl-ACP methyl ester carboxylesterase
MATKERILPPHFDEDGHVYWKSYTSPPDDSVAVCYMVPDRVIPVIFIPGVMGSNLADEKGDPVWLLNHKLSFAKTWARSGPKERKDLLDPLKTQVYFKGKIPRGTALSDEELRRRGWGSVAHASYGEFLVWLENSLHDDDTCKTGQRDQLRTRLIAAGLPPLTFDEVALSYKYNFPVHAVGYNWLQSNADSAEYLHTRIQEFMRYYTRRRFRCEKVILVTHSMGGLLARYYSEVLSQEEPYKKLGLREQILGVVHGVMPATGAAATYKRMKAGFEGPAAVVLGYNAGQVTAVLGNAPGPLQLLPSIDYGMGWLKLQDHQSEVKFPKADPYTEIYTVRHKWWGLINDKLLNPADRHKLAVEQDWKKFVSIITKHVATFHQSIRHKYHPQTYVFYGQDENHKTYGNVCWRRTVVASPVHSGRIVRADQGSLFRDDGLGTQETHQQSENGTIWATYRLRDMDEDGDGTVPARSGRAPLSAGPNIKACIPFQGIEHEAAYTNQGTRHFTLWAITKIAQQIKGTTLEYK